MRSPTEARRRTCGLLWLVVAAACGGDSAEPPPPPRIVVTPGSVEAHTSGQTFQFSARVIDSRGNAVSGATVAWTSSSDSVATVSPSGLATVVGQGRATITARVETASGSASIVADLKPGALIKVSGDGQTVPALTQAPEDPTVRVVDAAGLPLSGQLVEFEIVSRHERGSASPRSTRTNDAGRSVDTVDLGPRIRRRARHARLHGHLLRGLPSPRDDAPADDLVDEPATRAGDRALRRSSRSRRGRAAPRVVRPVGGLARRDGPRFGRRLDGRRGRRGIKRVRRGRQGRRGHGGDAPDELAILSRAPFARSGRVHRPRSAPIRCMSAVHPGRKSRRPLSRHFGAHRLESGPGVGGGRSGDIGTLAGHAVQHGSFAQGQFRELAPPPTTSSAAFLRTSDRDCTTRSAPA